MAVVTFKLTHKEVTIPTASVKALRATPYQLLVAPRSNQMIEFLEAAIRMDYNSVAYAEDAGGSNLGIKYTDGSGVQVSQDIEATGFIDQTVSTYTSSRPKIDAIVAKTGCAGQKLVLHNIGAGELVTGNSPLTVKVTYRIITLV